MGWYEEREREEEGEIKEVRLVLVIVGFLLCRLHSNINPIRTIGEVGWKKVSV